VGFVTCTHTSVSRLALLANYLCIRTRTSRTFSAISYNIGVRPGVGYGSIQTTSISWLFCAILKSMLQLLLFYGFHLQMHGVLSCSTLFENTVTHNEFSVQLNSIFVPWRYPDMKHKIMSCFLCFYMCCYNQRSFEKNGQMNKSHHHNVLLECLFQVKNVNT